MKIKVNNEVNVPRPTRIVQLEKKTKQNGKMIKQIVTVEADLCVLCNTERPKKSNSNSGDGGTSSDYTSHVRVMHTMEPLENICQLCFLAHTNRSNHHNLEKKSKELTISEQVNNINNLLPRDRLNDLFDCLLACGSTKMIKDNGNYYTSEQYSQLLRKRKIEEKERERRPLNMLNLVWTNDALKKKKIKK